MNFEVGDRVIDLYRKDTDLEKTGVVVDLPDQHARRFSSPSRSDDKTVAALSAPRFSDCRTDSVIGVVRGETFERTVGDWFRYIPNTALGKIVSDYDVYTHHYPACGVEHAEGATTAEEHAGEVIEVAQ
jgi:hypothetical protein